MKLKELMPDTFRKLNGTYPDTEHGRKKKIMQAEKLRKAREAKQCKRYEHYGLKYEH